MAKCAQGIIRIKDVYKDAEVSDSEARQFVKQLAAVAKLIPLKYTKNVPPVTIFICHGSPDAVSVATLNGNSAIKLYVRKNKSVQKIEAFHEFVHLVECFNRKLMKNSNIFLKSRLVSKKKVPIVTLGNMYSAMPSAQEVQVYDGEFIDPYAGRTYGDLNSRKPVPTEVLTVGCSEWILNKSNFKKKDPEHYGLVSDFLNGRI